MPNVELRAMYCRISSAKYAPTRGASSLNVPRTMGAFTLRVDSVAILVACGAGLALGIVGAIPPAVRAMKLPVAESLKAV